jgi:hypothetical protein
MREEQRSARERRKHAKAACARRARAASAAPHESSSELTKRAGSVDHFRRDGRPGPRGAAGAPGVLKPATTESRLDSRVSVSQLSFRCRADPSRCVPSS